MTTEKNWFERNWKWFVPTIVIGFFILVVGFIIGIFALVETGIKSSDVYKESLSRATTNKIFQTKLGEPIKVGFFISGSININNNSGNADLSIPISGNKKGATIYVIAKKEMGVWHYQTITVAIENSGERIDLLNQQ